MPLLFLFSLLIRSLSLLSIYLGPALSFSLFAVFFHLSFCFTLCAAVSFTLACCLLSLYAAESFTFAVFFSLS
jgi:hypothetical protein